MKAMRLLPLALAIAAACQPSPALAGGKPAAPKTSRTEVQDMLRQMQQRISQLEQKNAALEQQVQALRQNADTAPLAKRVQQLERDNAEIAQSLASDTLSEKEPELTVRLKAVEQQTLDMQKSARKINDLDGLTVAASLTTVAQKPFAETPRANSQLNWRGDVTLELPLGSLNRTEQKLFAHFRFGQGRGLNDLATFAKPNGSAFQLSQNDEAPAMLAQAWYQASIPLDGRSAADARQMLEVNFGKMDPFQFFDQNAAANDEGRQFMNAVFVHNPLLDAGGDIAVDANGFTPGLRLSWVSSENRPETWRASLGVFGAGSQGANYQRSLRAPLLLAQLETSQRIGSGLPGNYRIYAWRQSQASHFDEAQTAAEVHAGVGLSVDQRISDNLQLFARLGRQVQGNVRFDRAATVGVEIGGNAWERSADSLGLGFAWLRSSNAWRDFAGSSQNERMIELYYRWRISRQFELSPDLQYIMRPAGSNASALRLIGLRAQISY